MPSQSTAGDAPADRDRYHHAADHRGRGDRRRLRAPLYGRVAALFSLLASLMVQVGCGDPLPLDDMGQPADDVAPDEQPERDRPFAALEVESPFPGYLFVPDGPGPHPGMIVLHGSDGGQSLFSRNAAERLAELGYAALALCWFDCRHFEADGRSPPDELVRIPLEYTQQALAWLKGSPHVAGRGVGVYGGSRGAEHALLLAAFSEGTGLGVRPDIVVATSATDMVIPGLPADIDRDDPDPNRVLPNAWTWHGVELPAGSPIGVEFYSGPIFFDYGLEDALWPPAVQPWNIVHRALSSGRSVRWYGFREGWDPDFVATDLVAPVSAYDVYPAGGWRRLPTLVGVGYFDQGHILEGDAATVRPSAMRAFIELHLPR